MLNLLKLKQEKAAAKESGGEEGAKGGKVIPAAQRRVQKDLKTGIEKNSWCDMEFPDPDDIMNFTVTLKPDEGFWKGGKFTFKFEIPADYPHSPPKTLCVTKLFHPNIDVEGKVQHTAHQPHLLSFAFLEYLPLPVRFPPSLPSYGEHTSPSLPLFSLSLPLSLSRSRSLSLSLSLFVSSALSPFLPFGKHATKVTEVDKGERASERGKGCGEMLTTIHGQDIKSKECP